MIKKIKLIASSCLLMTLLSCAPTSFIVWSRDIQVTCVPHAVYKIENAIPHKSNVIFAHYKNCFDYENVLIIKWTKYNTTAIKIVVEIALQRYARHVNMIPKLIQWEQWGDGFYAVYELKNHERTKKKTR